MPTTRRPAPTAGRFLREAQATLDDPPYQRELLPGGALLLAEPVSSVPSLALGIWVRSGSVAESADEAGLAHFIEHLVFKGTRRHSAYRLAQQMEAIGGQVDAFTTKETTCFYARVFEGHHDEAVRLLTELVAQPAFAADQLERERDVIEEEIQSYDDTPEERLQDVAAELVFRGHPLGHPILGTVESLREVRVSDVKRFHRRHYTAHNLIVTAAGRFDLPTLRDSLTRGLRLPRTAAPATRRTPKERPPSERHEERDLQQASLCLVRRAASARAPERHAEAIFNTILGAGMSSRLFQRIREAEGLAYSVYSFHDTYRSTGMFGVYLGCQPNKLRRAFTLVQREFTRIRDGGIRRWELESARAQLLMNLFLSYESMYERINRLAYNELHHGGQVPLARAVAEISDVTAEQVAVAARALLDPAHFSLATVGPAGHARPRLADLDF